MTDIEFECSFEGATALASRPMFKKPPLHARLTWSTRTRSGLPYVRMYVVAPANKKRGDKPEIPSQYRNERGRVDPAFSYYQTVTFKRLYTREAVADLLEDLVRIMEVQIGVNFECIHWYGHNRTKEGGRYGE